MLTLMVAILLAVSHFFKHLKNHRFSSKLSAVFVCFSNMPESIGMPSQGSRRYAGKGPILSTASGKRRSVPQGAVLKERNASKPCGDSAVSLVRDVRFLQGRWRGLTVVPTASFSLFLVSPSSSSHLCRGGRGTSLPTFSR